MWGGLQPQLGAGPRGYRAGKDRDVGMGTTGLGTAGPPPLPFSFLPPLGAVSLFPACSVFPAPRSSARACGKAAPSFPPPPRGRKRRSGSTRGRGGERPPGSADANAVSLLLSLGPPALIGVFFSLKSAARSLLPRGEDCPGPRTGGPPPVPLGAPHCVWSAGAKLRLPT